jgi:NADH:ubiquinone oxidoreductase subunit C
MDTESALQTAATVLAPWARSSERPHPSRLDVRISLKHLLPAVAALKSAHWGYLAAITGLDHPGTPADMLDAEDISELGATTGLTIEPGAVEALYQFCSGAAITTLRVRMPRVAASLTSICHLIPAASFYERELAEMFGVTVVDTPDPRRLFLPDDWPDSVYPLRKDFVVDAPTEPVA